MHQGQHRVDSLTKHQATSHQGLHQTLRHTGLFAMQSQGFAQYRDDHPHSTCSRFHLHHDHECLIQNLKQHPSPLRKWFALRVPTDHCRGQVLARCLPTSTRSHALLAKRHLFAKQERCSSRCFALRICTDQRRSDLFQVPKVEARSRLHDALFHSNKCQSKP